MPIQCARVIRGNRPCIRSGTTDRNEFIIVRAATATDDRTANDYTSRQVEGIGIVTTVDRTGYIVIEIEDVGPVSTGDIGKVRVGHSGDSAIIDARRIERRAAIRTD